MSHPAVIDHRPVIPIRMIRIKPADILIFQPQGREIPKGHTEILLVGLGPAGLGFVYFLQMRAEVEIHRHLFIAPAPEQGQGVFPPGHRDASFIYKHSSARPFSRE